MPWDSEFLRLQLKSLVYSTYVCIAAHATHDYRCLIVFATDFRHNPIIVRLSSADRREEALHDE